MDGAAVATTSGARQKDATQERAFRLLAEHVIIRALKDLAQPGYGGYISEVDQESAAMWFVSNMHIPWCDTAGVDADQVKQFAINLADQLRNHYEHPHIYRAPIVDTVDTLP